MCGGAAHACSRASAAAEADAAHGASRDQRGEARSLSKLLGKLLRPQGENLGVAISEDGWVALSDVLRAINGAPLRASSSRARRDPRQSALGGRGAQAVALGDKQRFVCEGERGELAGGAAGQRRGTRWTRHARGRAHGAHGRDGAAPPSTAPTGPAGTPSCTARADLSRMGRHHIPSRAASRRRRLGHAARRGAVGGPTPQPAATGRYLAAERAALRRQGPTGRPFCRGRRRQGRH